MVDPSCLISTRKRQATKASTVFLWEIAAVAALLLVLLIVVR